MGDLDAEFEALLARFQEATTEEDTTQALREFEKMPIEFLRAKGADLRARLHDANENLSATFNRLALVNMIEGAPTSASEPFHPERAGVEVALAALVLLRRTGRTSTPDDIGAVVDEPDLPPQFASCLAAAETLGEHLKVAAYYLLDADASHSAIASEPPQGETFPPLPFPQVWVEMAHLTPYAYFAALDSDDPDPAFILGIGVVEIEQGKVWDVFVPYEFEGRDASLVTVIVLRIAPGHVLIPDPGLGELSAAAFNPIRQLVVGGIHLITARNAPVHEVAIARPQRRRIEREHSMSPPRLYFVDIGSAGEHGTGNGGRVYTVRWLVRGHWRHKATGRSFCTCCDPPQIASWVAPYIKGPATAPWKGRQVRRVAS